METKSVWKHNWCFQFDFQRSFLKIHYCADASKELISIFFVEKFYRVPSLEHKTPITENNTFMAESVLTRVSYLTRKLDCLNSIKWSSELTLER